MLFIHRGNSLYWHVFRHEIPDCYDQQLTKPLIIKWLVAPCNRVICVRKVTASNYNFCLCFVSGLRIVAAALGRAVLFKFSYLRWRTGSCFESRTIISQELSKSNFITKEEVSEQEILNIWQICFVKCVFRLPWTIVHRSPIVWNHPKQFHFFRTASSHPNFKHIGNTSIFTSRL